MNKKCSECGMVNWNDVNECARCNSFLRKAQTVESKSAAGPPHVSNGLKAGIVAFVLLALCFLGYQVFYNSNNKLRTSKEVNSNVNTTQVMQVPQADLNSLQKQNDKVNLEMKKNIEAMQNPPKFDFSKGQKQAEQIIRMQK